MAIKYVGKAAVWGHSASIAPITSNCIGTLLIQSYRLKPSADKFDLNDQIGTVGRIAANRMETLTVEGIFSSTLSSGQIADAAAQSVRVPRMNDVVQITSTSAVDPATDPVAGYWLVADCEKTADVKSPQSISLTLERFPDSAAMNGMTMTVMT